MKFSVDFRPINLQIKAKTFLRHLQLSPSYRCRNDQRSVQRQNQLLYCRWKCIPGRQIAVCVSAEKIWPGWSDRQSIYWISILVIAVKDTISAYVYPDGFTPEAGRRSLGGSSTVSFNLSPVSSADQRIVQRSHPPVYFWCCEALRQCWMYWMTGNTIGFSQTRCCQQIDLCCQPQNHCRRILKLFRFEIWLWR